MASTNGPQIEMMLWILSTHPVDIVFVSLGEILSGSFVVVKGLLTVSTDEQNSLFSSVAAANMQGHYSGMMEI